MRRLVIAAEELKSFMQEQRWSYCIVGGLAIQRWGEPRTTQDVDICLFTGLGREQAFIKPLLNRFTSRIANAADFAEKNRVLLIQASNDVSIDVALGWTPFEEQMLARATPFNYAAEIALPTASAEDLVVTKAFANRPLDWVDVERILARQRGSLDWKYIQQELTGLCELTDSPEAVLKLENLRTKIDRE